MSRLGTHSADILKYPEYLLLVIELSGNLAAKLIIRFLLGFRDSIWSP